MNASVRRLIFATTAVAAVAVAAAALLYPLRPEIQGLGGLMFWTALTLVGLGDRVHHLPKQLSGGQEQRVAIARAIVTDPTLLLADEPTGDLDSHSAAEVLEIMKRLNEEFGKTVVMVTHDPNAAAYAHITRHLEKGMLLPG